MKVTPRSILLFVSCLAIALPAMARDDGNLIEYSYGGFAEGMEWAGPMLYPPPVKIYADGRIVFFEDSRFWVGTVEPRKLERLERHLARNDLLSETYRLIPVRKGSSPGYHGGMAYIRYLSGEDEILVGATLLPSSGPWARLVDRVRDCIPSEYRTFLPAEARFSVHTRESPTDARPWPFSASHSLEAEDSVVFSNPEVLAAVFGDMNDGFSWLSASFSEGEQVYLLMLDEVPGWFDDSGLSALLGAMYVEQREEGGE